MNTQILKLRLLYIVDGLLSTQMTNKDGNPVFREMLCFMKKSLLFGDGYEDIPHSEVDIENIAEGYRQERKLSEEHGCTDSEFYYISMVVETVKTYFDLTEENVDILSKEYVLLIPIS